MESIRIPFRKDDFGNDIFARVTWFSNETQPSKPIALIYHGGGLIIGSSEIIPQPQVNWLARHGFLVVIPNYRLAPQVTGATSLADGVEAHDWAISSLVETMKAQYGVNVALDEAVVMGHSSGGTMALHVGSCRPVKAVTAFYPSLYLSKEFSRAHEPYNEPPFNNIPDYTPTEEDWKEIAPATMQISESSLPLPTTPPAPRNRWQMAVSTKGKWISSLCPDGDFASVDPLTRLNKDWPPTMFVSGELDTIPGSSLDLVQRAEQEMQDAGVKEVIVKVVPSVGHMFDVLKPLGTEDLGSEWQAVVEGLHFLASHVKR